MPHITVNHLSHARYRQLDAVFSEWGKLFDGSCVVHHMQAKCIEFHPGPGFDVEQALDILYSAEVLDPTKDDVTIFGMEMRA